jgi:DNA polymerase
MHTGLTPEGALAALAWQIDLGADEAIGDVPISRHAAPENRAAGREEAPAAAAPPGAAPPAAPAAGDVDPVAEARRMADAATTLEELRAALGAFAHCELRKGARNTVFADGTPGARVMIVGEAPGREEDIEGRPFVGRAGRLLDKMLEAVSMGRHAEGGGAVYITNVLPWRPPQNRDPTPAEIAMLLPFLERHVALAAPEVIVLMGNIACAATLGRRGITRLRGSWTEALGRPALPMFHPAYLLRTPSAKREAWADLLALQARLRSPAP